MGQSKSNPRYLERALLFTIACHGIAMVTMALVLMPGMPNSGSVEQQMAYIAHHAWTWRTGWFPWQMTAFSDLLLCLAIVRSPRMPRLAAWIGLALTLIALGLEQPWEYRWSTEGIQLAQSGIVVDYLAFRQSAFVFTSYYAATFYAFAAIAWSVAFAQAKIWSRFLTWWSVATWSIFLAASVLPLVSSAIPLTFVSTADGIGFCMLMVWLIAAWLLVHRTQVASAT